MHNYTIDGVCPPHSTEWHEARRSGIGGSEANILCSGNNDRILALWQQKCGLAEPDDLSKVLPVQMGNVTEALNLAWLAEAIGQEVYFDPATCESLGSIEHPFMRANLDGRAADGAIVEAKFTGKLCPVEDLYRDYYPQMQHNMAVTGAGQCYLSVIFGAHARHDHLLIDRDDDYIDSLITAEADFWHCVQTQTLPDYIDMPVAIPPTPYEQMRVRDMSMGNESGTFLLAAQAFEETNAATAENAAAKKVLLSFLDEETRELSHPDTGVIVTRTKGGKRMIKINQGE